MVASALRSIAKQHGGHVLQATPDSLLLRFPSAARAVECAVEMQETLERSTCLRPDRGAVHCRIGVHAAVSASGIVEIGARQRAVAERLCALATPGGISLSSAARSHVGPNLPVSYEAVREHRTQGCERPPVAYQVLREKVLRFGCFELDLDRRELRREGVVVAMQRRPLEVLAHLVQRRDRFVSKQELFESVWSDTVVSEAALFSALRDVRRALGDDGRHPAWIETARGRGFRFVAPVASRPEPVAIETSRGVEPPGPVLVGRDDLVAFLEDALAEACRGRGRIVLLAGEAGVGKTRLAQEIARRAEARGLRALWGWCGDGDGAPSYRPWIAVLRAALHGVPPEDVVRRLPLQAPWLARLLPELRSVAAEAALPADPRDARLRLFDAVLALLRAVAAASPLVVVLDDLHASDPASLELLRLLAMQVGDARLLVVGTHRDTQSDLAPGQPLHVLLPALLREERATRCTLHGLSVDATAALIAAIAGHEPSPHLVRRLHERTAGNPLLLEATLRDLVGAVPDLDRAAELEKVLGGDATPVGGALRPLVERLLARLGPTCQTLLEVASIAGPACDRALLDAVETLRGQPLDELLERACAARVLVEADASSRAYRFHHPLVRDAVYARLGAQRTRALHLAVGRAIERRAGADARAIAALAYHFERAGNEGLEKAFAYAVQAGRAAQAELAYEDAAAHFDRALALQERAGGADPKLRCELLLSLGEAARAEQPERAQAAFARAADLARALRAHALLARAALGLENARWTLEPERPLACVSILEEALAALPADDLGLRAELLARLAYARAWAGGEGAEDAAAAAVAIARRTSDRSVLARALGARHYALWRPEHLAERSALAREMASTAEDPVDVSLGQQWIFLDALRTGDLASAERALEAARAAAAVHRIPWRAGMVRLAEGQLALLQGRFEAAERTALAAFRDAERLPSAALRNGASALLVGLRFFQRRLAELLPVVEAARLADFEPVRLLALFEAGRSREAREDLRALLRGRGLSAPHNVSTPIALALLSDLCGRLGDAGAADVLADALRAWLPQNLVAPAPAFAGSSFHWMGVLSDARGRPDEAIELLEQALAAHRDFEALPWIAWTQAALAQSLRRRGASGDDARAVACADAARASAARLGMPGLAVPLPRAGGAGLRG
jgi:DNA-binding winged helix-turn-helix (wHTH) protein/tetratricopeptide (TPR) repeat protein